MTARAAIHTTIRIVPPHREPNYPPRLSLGPDLYHSRLSAALGAMRASRERR
jgi:hypothetical protein